MIASISIKIKEPGLYCKKRFHNGFRSYIVVEKKIYGEGRQLAGKPKDFGEELRGHGGIFIVIENFIIRSSLE
jgi:hypothetical protein